MDRKMYFAIVAALATAAALVTVSVLVAPFAKPLAWALIIGVATMPHYHRILARMPRAAPLAAGIMVLLVTLCLVLPITGLSIITAENASTWLKETEQILKSVGTMKPKTFISHLPILKRLSAIAGRAGIDVTFYAGKVASAASQFILDAATSAAKNMAAVLFTLALTLFILFFIYRDGDKIVHAAVATFPEHRETVLRYLWEIQSTTTAVVVGTLFTCLVQGGLAGVGYYVAGTPLPILCAVLTAGAGLLPVIGTAAIWVPLVVYIAVTQSYLTALLLSLWCLIVVVAITDNVIRPLAVGAKSETVPALAVVLGAVGGVMAMGVLGLIAGPILFAIVVMIWRDITRSGTDRGSAGG